jgi:hypothetical protein
MQNCGMQEADGETAHAVSLQPIRYLLVRSYRLIAWSQSGP